MSGQIPTQASRKQAELCANIIERVSAEVAQGHPADRALARIYREHRHFGSRDRRLFSNLVFSWFRWRGWLKSADKPGAADIVSAFLLDSEDVHPSIEQLSQVAGITAPLQPMGALSIEEKAVALARRDGLEHVPLPLQLVPEWTAARLAHGAENEREVHLLRCIEAFQSRPPTWIRIKTQARDATVELMSNFAQPARGSLPCARALEKRADWENFPGRSRAEMEIQDLASQCVGLICDPAPGQEWWDACAGSGGKALHLADLMANGRVYATDMRAGILREAARRAQQAGAGIISFREWDGRADPAPGRLFDGVLVDAPCSGLGTWHRNPDARWRTSDSTVTERAATQISLLSTAASKVRPGGRLVYSVCTLTRDETEGVVDRFLKSQSQFKLSPAVHPLTGEETGGVFWIWPWQARCNGMFIAAFRKDA